jgi:peptidoglycan/xylan/chitin deacetylase (PgdA/CDA1 family)
MVEDRFDWGVTRVPPRKFKKQIENALDHEFTFLTLSEYLATRHLNDGLRRAAICFDDGYESVFQHAFPVLQQHGIPATVFLVVGFMGQFNTWDVNIGWLRFRHLDWPQTRKLVKAGWEFGSHGMTHRDFSRLPCAELEWELRSSKLLIEKKTGIPVSLVSYPFGNTNLQVYQVCLDAGYKAGLAMGRSYKMISADYAISRHGIYLFDSLLSFNQKLLGKNNWFYNFIQKIFDICSDGTVLVKQGISFKKNRT